MLECWSPTGPSCALQIVAGPLCEPQGRPGAGAPRPEASHTKSLRRSGRVSESESGGAMSELKGWALTLGASSGFGEAVSLALARAGLNIFGVHLDRKATLGNVERI